MPNHEPCPQPCPHEECRAPAAAPEEGQACGSPGLFDDESLVQNVPADSQELDISDVDRVRITGVYTARSAVGTIVFTILVSTDQVNWTSLGGFNASALGSFSSAFTNLNARFLKVRATTSAPAILVFSSWVWLARKQPPTGNPDAPADPDPPSPGADVC